MDIQKMYIDGKWQLSASNKTREIIDPATEKCIALVTDGTSEDVDHAVGLVLNKKIGDHVEIGETLLTVYARNKVSQEIIEEIYKIC